MLKIRKFLEGIGISPKAASTADTQGEMEVLSTDGKLRYHNGTSVSPVVTEAHTATLTNKTISGASNTITNISSSALTALTANRAVVSDGSGFISAATTTATEIGYVNGVTSAIQTQLNAKLTSTLTSANIFVGNGSNVATAVAVSGDLTLDNTGNFQIATGAIVNADINASAAIAVSKLAAVTVSRALASDASGFISATSVTSTELGYLSGVTSAIQTQLNNKASGSGSASGTNTGDVTLAAVGSSPNANGASLSGQVLNLQPADATNPGVVTTGDQTLAGVKTFSSAPNLSSLTASRPLKLDGSKNITATQIDLTSANDVTGVLPAANVGLTRTINAQTGTSYTFVLSDGSAAGGNTLVTASNASAQTYTVPPNSSVAFPVGTQIDVVQLGAGKVTIAQGSGVTINSKSSNKAIGAQYVGVTLVKTATDTWLLLGDLIA